MFHESKKIYQTVEIPGYRQTLNYDHRNENVTRKEIEKEMFKHFI